MLIGQGAITLRSARDDPWTLIAIPIIAGLVHVAERVGRARSAASMVGAPLVLVTPAPQDLVETIAARASGTPHP